MVERWTVTSNTNPSSYRFRSWAFKGTPRNANPHQGINSFLDGIVWGLQSIHQFETRPSSCLVIPLGKSFQELPKHFRSLGFWTGRSCLKISSNFISTNDLTNKPSQNSLYFLLQSFPSKINLPSIPKPRICHQNLTEIPKNRSNQSFLKPYMDTIFQGISLTFGIISPREFPGGNCQDPPLGSNLRTPTKVSCRSKRLQWQISRRSNQNHRIPHTGGTSSYLSWRKLLPKAGSSFWWKSRGWVKDTIGVH